MGGNEIEIDDDIKLIEKTMPKQQQNLIVMNTMINFYNAIFKIAET